MHNKYDQPLMETAKVWAKMSCCKKRKVGCVIAIDNRIISIGYNGTISGNHVSNECEEEVVECLNCGSVMTKYTLDEIHHQGRVTPVKKYFCSACGTESVFTGSSDIGKLKTKETVVHAEQNALMFAVKNGVSVNNGVLYTTTLPCNTCAKLIVQSGIKKVVYLEEHDENGRDILVSGNVITVKYKK